MIPLLLAAHDPMDHVLPHRFGPPLFHWNVNWTAPLDIFRWTPHDTYFTNQLMMTLVAAGVLLFVMTLVGRRYSVMMAGGVDRCVPTGFAGAIEGILSYLRDSVVKPVLGDKTDRFLPFLWTIFFYILTCNLLGMIPLDGIFYLVSGGKWQHFGGTATGNVMITAGLAICAFFMIHLSGTAEVYGSLVKGTYGHHHEESPDVIERVGTAIGSAMISSHGALAPRPHLHHEADEAHSQHGFHGHGHQAGMSPISAVFAAPCFYLWNFAPHVFKPEKMEGIGSVLMWVMDLVMWVILLALELIGATIKPFALAIRLFANMIAGHVVIASILALIFVFEGSVAVNYGMGIISSLGAAALSLLELFVAFLQAYVFTFLTTLFIGASVSPEH